MGHVTSDAGPICRHVARNKGINNDWPKMFIFHFPLMFYKEILNGSQPVPHAAPSSGSLCGVRGVLGSL
jgi:hypothetical protein